MAVINVSNVSKSYGSVQALKQVNLTVNQGDIYGFINRNLT